MFSSASSTENRGSTPKNTDGVAVRQVQVDQQRRLARRPAQRRREVDGDGGAADAALGADDRERSCPHRLGDRRRATRRMAASSSSCTSGSDTHSLTPMRIASSSSVGIERPREDHDAGAGELALRPAPISRGRRGSSRMSITNASGPFEPTDARSRGPRARPASARNPRSRNPAGARDRPSRRAVTAIGTRLPHQRDADDKMPHRACCPCRPRGADG